MWAKLAQNNFVTGTQNLTGLPKAGAQPEYPHLPHLKPGSPIHICGTHLAKTGPFIAPVFLGQRCTVDIDECVSKPCMNHGLCHNTQGSYMCECPPGFSGMDCEEDIDDCLASEYASQLVSPVRHTGSRAEPHQGSCPSVLRLAIPIVYHVSLILGFFKSSFKASGFRS